MEEKQFQSIVKRVVLVPLTVLVLVLAVTVVSCLFSFFNMQQQMVESNINSLRISASQLDALLSQIDHAFLEYWNSNESYSFLKNYSEDTPKEVSLIHEADAITWIQNLANSHMEVQGGFAYYKNMDLFLMRGISNFSVNKYIRDRLSWEQDCYNHWELVEIEGALYLMNLKNYNDFYGGVWIPAGKLEERLSLTTMGYLGTVYLADNANHNTLGNEEMNGLLENEERRVTKLQAGNNDFYNYTVPAESDGIVLGILIPRETMFSMIPLADKIIFLVAFLSVFLVPVTVMWLKKKIANPMRDIDFAMKLIGEGNMDYRIPLSEKRYYDEFDRLIMAFNRMMEDLNELEFKLYKTKIKEQRTELKYISQQIRPHFMLNALNIIYTYEENEFPLVKKMVLYLTGYFRYIVNLKVDFVEVEKELRHVENYLNIQKERYQDRFEFFVEWEIQTERLLIPPLIIQTFVENCIKYAIKHEGTVFIYALASIEKDRLKLMVADTGPGFSRQALEQIRQFIKTREIREELGVGIQNAIERLDILYEGQVEVTVRNALSGGAVVELYLPMLPGTM